VRGVEQATIESPTTPTPRRLVITALGGSPGTPPDGVVAEVIEVRSLDEVHSLGDRARGKIVLFQHEMLSGAVGYGEAGRLRNHGPAEAAKVGAVAALVRAAASATLRTAHTGATDFPAGDPSIPAASVSHEDADLLHRLLARGPVRLRLTLGCGLGTPPEVESANVIAEVRGREKSNEVVVLGAHLDSWDLATGAIDDGAGIAMIMDALRLVARTGVAPRRTLRIVLFMNEEHGLNGGIAYADHHASEHHVAAIEADSGAGRPFGFGVEAGAGGVELVTRLAGPLASLGAAKITAGGGGADISPLRYAGVPTLSLSQDTTHYFDWHHSTADTLDKVDPRELALDTAAMAVMGWQLADAAETLAAPDAPKNPPWWRAPAGVSGQK
jgi:Zn-dependent M28 family amino/carboxypeptidase